MSSESERSKREAQQNIDAAKQKASDEAHHAKDKAVGAKNDFVARLKDDGVVNPKGFAMAAFGPIFLAAIPAVTFVAQPGGLLQKAVNGVVHSAAFVATAGSSSAVAQTGKISALSFVYLAATYAFGGAISAASIDAGSEGGRDNLGPRKQILSLKGLPFRLNSAVQHTFDNFPAFALVAALAQAISPADQSIVNLLGLHVLAKLTVYGPAYALNYGNIRSLGHIIATSSMLAVAVKLIKAPLL